MHAHHLAIFKSQPTLAEIEEPQQMKLLQADPSTIKNPMNQAATKHKNILLLSGGSKVAIARIAKKAAQQRGATLHISDTQPEVPSRHVADSFLQLPKHHDPAWADSLANACQTHKIGLIIPTRHSELQSLLSLKRCLEENGTAVSLSGEQSISLCIHKTNTYDFFKAHGLQTPQTFSPAELPESIPYPLIAKPVSGASAIGVRTIQNATELKSVTTDWILQEEAKGIEFTTNLYLDKNGEVLCAIPHHRISVEAGEVVQARTKRHQKIIDLCTRAARALPDAQGIINIQAFYDAQSDTASLIEINPRIGGGYPLCDAAKGHYIEWLCQEHLDQTPPVPFSAWTENLLMQRYRDAIFSL